MASNTTGCITEFNPENEKKKVYLERVQFFFQMVSKKINRFQFY